MGRDQEAGGEGHFRVSEQQQLNSEPVRSGQMSVLRASVVSGGEARATQLNIPSVSITGLGIGAVKMKETLSQNFIPDTELIISYFTQLILPNPSDLPLHPVHFLHNTHHM